jgi:hypothetical protein
MAEASASIYDRFGVDASGNVVNRGIVVAPTGRVVLTTATALSLTVTEHAERILLVQSNSTVANTFTLPAATGSGNKFILRNGLVQTQGTVVFKAAGTDVITGFCFAVNATAGNSDQFATSASSTKMTLNLTTTGGLGGDEMEAVDYAAGTWLVDCKIAGSGTLATPFAA